MNKVEVWDEPIACTDVEMLTITGRNVVHNSYTDMGTITSRGYDIMLRESGLIGSMDSERYYAILRKDDMLINVTGYFSNINAAVNEANDMIHRREDAIAKGKLSRRGISVI